MGKYSTHSRQAPRPKRGVVHPVMRGIGCIMIVVVPILAYGLSVLVVNYGVNHGWPIPPGWLGTPSFHPLLSRLSGIATVLAFLRTQNNLFANIVFAIALTIVIGGVMSVIYGYIYTIFGPPRYGPTDAPPPRVKAKPYKR
jgi:hypothetical protein